MEVVLYEPEIPPNTGNVARLCAVTGTVLHLIEPLGFKLEDRYLKRAGLDYWPKVAMNIWPSFTAFLEEKAKSRPELRIIMTSSRAGGTPLHHFAFQQDDILVFGPETRGLPQELFCITDYRVRIPMRRGGGRCINLSTSCGIVLYAALASSGAMEGEEWEPL